MVSGGMPPWSAPTGGREGITPANYTEWIIQKISTEQFIQQPAGYTRIRFQVMRRFTKKFQMNAIRIPLSWANR